MMIIFVTILLGAANAQTYFPQKNGRCEANTSQPPAAFAAVCGSANIIEWKKVPHDWDSNMADGDGTCRPDGNGNIQSIPQQGKDLWYWGDDWSQKIAAGDGDKELIGTDKRCGNGSPQVQLYQNNSPGQIVDMASVDECSKRCMFAMSTTGVSREKCQYFDWQPDTVQDSNGNVGPDPSGSGTCTMYTQCYWGLQDVALATTYRLRDIYPVGFKAFSLREFNEPPTCIHVPNSRDKKVEVMIETGGKDSRVCIMDGNDMGIGTNADVGNVKTCDNGQLYACFTAATRTNEDFYFYIFCDGSCEAADVDLWVRIRVSERPWSVGKTDTESDIEMWCEMEKGSKATHEVAGLVTGTTTTQEDLEFTWPSELLPDYPNQLPFRIAHTTRSPANKAFVSPCLLLTLLGAALWNAAWL